MTAENLPIITIVGPTASGKSSLAIRMAELLGGEVVSADSMQIYRGMDIGTAKVRANETTVPHHMIDIVDPGTPYSAQQYQKFARACFDDIRGRGNAIILCGGTGLYVQAALEDMEFPSGERANNPKRDRWQEIADTQGADVLWSKLYDKDPRSAEVIHPNNVRRVIRALEMHDEGISYAEQKAHFAQLAPVYESLRFGLAVDREVLNQRIYDRVDRMFEQGLVDEVTALLDQGFTKALTAPQAIGYKEVVAALQGSCTLDDARQQIKIATRRYAKRQRSWFRRDGSIKWIDATQATVDQLASQLLTVIQNNTR